MERSEHQSNGPLTAATCLPSAQVLFLSMMFRRYPEYMKTAMWCGLLLYFICLFCSSFATQVSFVHLITRW